MPMIEELESQGRWLFRWRSYLPLLMLVLILVSLRDYGYPFQSESLDRLWDGLCLLVGFAGLLVRGLVAGYVPQGTSGRNTRSQVADTLNTTGMYSIVRNPLYLGNYVMGLAVSLFIHVWWIPLIFTLTFMLYYERIIFSEEMYLRKKFGQGYMDWASRTPVFIPRFTQWEASSLSLSVRTLIRREYQSGFGFIVALFVLEMLTELVLGHGWGIDPMWRWIMGVAVGGYAATRFLHKKTGLLEVEGR